MPITWRNIDIGSNNSANALINAGGDQIVQGISGLGGIVDGINKVDAANVVARTKVNTEDAVATLAGITDSKALAAAMGTGGALNKDTLRGKYGTELDMNKTSALLETKKSELSRLDTEAEIRDENRATHARERLEDNQFRNEGLKLQRENAAAQRQQNQLAVYEINRRLKHKDEGQRLEQTVMNIRKTYTDPAKAEAEIQKLVTSLPASGFSQLGAAEAATIANSTSSIYKSGPVSQQFTDTVEAVNKLGANSLAVVKKEEDALIKQFKTTYKINDQVVKLQQDNSLTPGAETSEIADYLFTGSKTPQGDERDNVASQYREIENLFKNNGVKNPSSAVIKEAFMRSQADDGSLWWDRDSYSVDKSVVRELAKETAQAEEFISGGLRKSFDDLQIAVLTEKEKVLDAQKQVGNLLKLKQAEEQQIISTKGADAQYVPIKLDDLNELRYRDVGKTDPVMTKNKLTGLLEHTKLDPITAATIDAEGSITRLRQQLDKDAALMRKAEEEAVQPPVLLNADGRPTTTWNTNFFPDKAKLAAEKKAKYGE